MTADVNGGTEYVVLKRITIADQADPPYSWIEVARTVARDGQTAIKAAHGSGNTETYVVIPARSWSPVKVTPKVETTLTLEEAK